MPKERVSSLSTHQARAFPYHPYNINNTGLKSEKSSLTIGDEREWEEARCPICMDHPHNAVLLLCSSAEKGCRPYMCDTSYRHSNCLDQFCKSGGGRMEEPFRESHIRSLGDQLLGCPLCRGQVRGCVVIKAARQFMDSKPRSCSLETCCFNGTYMELRKHAREEHPYQHPFKSDPGRESEWARLQLQTDYDDSFSAYLSLFEDDSGGSSPPYSDFFEVFDAVYSEESGDEWIAYDVLEREFPFSFLHDD